MSLLLGEKVLLQFGNFLQPKWKFVLESPARHIAKWAWNRKLSLIHFFNDSSRKAGLSHFALPYHSVWKPQKKSHSTLRAKRATFTFWVDKSSSKMPKIVHLASFWKPCSATRQEVLIGQKLMKNAKIQIRLFEWILNTVLPAPALGVPLETIKKSFFFGFWKIEKRSCICDLSKAKNLSARRRFVLLFWSNKNTIKDRGTPDARNFSPSRSVETRNGGGIENNRTFCQ